MSFGGAGKGGLRRQGLHFRASSLETSVAGSCRPHSAALRLLLALRSCCSVLFRATAVLSIPGIVRKFPPDEGHTWTDSDTQRLVHTRVVSYRNLSFTCVCANRAAPRAHKAGKHEGTMSALDFANDTWCRCSRAGALCGRKRSQSSTEQSFCCAQSGDESK